MNKTIPISDLILDGKSVLLRPVTVEDVSDDYEKWMNATEVNRFLETRFKRHTKLNIKEFIQGMEANPDIFFFAICKADKRHIGNVKLGPVKFHHRRGEISLWIGDKSCWGRGYGSETIVLVRNFAIYKLKVHKITAGCYSDNIGFARSFEKTGFAREAILKHQYFCEAEWVDRHCYSFIAPRGGNDGEY